MCDAPTISRRGHVLCSTIQGSALQSTVGHIREEEGLSKSPSPGHPLVASRTMGADPVRNSGIEGRQAGTGIVFDTGSTGRSDMGEKGASKVEEAQLECLEIVDSEVLVHEGVHKVDVMFSLGWLNVGVVNFYSDIVFCKKGT